MIEGASRDRRPAAAWMLAAATAVGLLLFGYKALDHYTRGYPVPLHVPLIEELTAAFGAALLLSLIVPKLVGSLQDRGDLWKGIALNLGGALGFSILHTSLNWLARTAIFAALGERYDYGRMPARYAMELPMDVVVYASFAAALIAIRHRRLAQRRHAEALASDAKLAEARLGNLRSQLDPHFLFNALNTISAVMYEDPERADEIIGHLSMLLRASLQSGDAREVSLRDELRLVQHYFAIIRARFGDKAELDVDIPESLLDASIPPVTLQPLVENAVRHGRLADGKAGRIEVRARQLDGVLALEVADDGGIAAGQASKRTGVGLGGLGERLRLMYGDAGTVTVVGTASGFAVSVRIPFRLAGGAS